MESLPKIPISKRILDLTITSVGMIVILPVMGIVALLVRVFLGAPVVFKQVRPGYGGRPFTLLKFRTMTDKRDAHGDLLPDEERLPRFGRILRATSLDELPEFFNILRGEMSIVGPRPLLMRYLERYNDEQARRHHVLPGITGWAQINGGNNVSWEEKFKLDVWYVDNWSVLLDLKIMLLTPIKVFAREGINQPGNATAQEFMGEE